jgi:Lipase (class 3)
MPSINYDPTRVSLFSPYKQETVFSTNIHLITAGVCAELSRLAYIPVERDTIANQVFLNKLKTALTTAGLVYAGHFDISSTGTQCFAATLGAQLVIAFRGSEPDLADIATDLTTWHADFGNIDGVLVHSGFKSAFESVWPTLKDKFGTALNTAIFTGHSLGAALATLAAFSVNNQEPPVVVEAKLYVFGSPAVGNDVFANHLTGITAERYVNCCDIVSRIPPLSLGFQHVGVRKYIDKNGTIGTVANANAEDIDQSSARSDYFSNDAWRIGTVIFRDLADHAPINYIRALWP